MKPARRSAKRAAAPSLRTRSDWRGLTDLALTCVRDAEAAMLGFSDADRRRMDLLRRCGSASTEMLEREAGAGVGDAAKALIDLGRAWARPETPASLRVELTPSLKAVAGFLDDRLHALATQAFERAHHGRPEAH